MIRFLSVVLPLSLASCIYSSAGPPPLAPLAEDQAQPGPALAEHVLTAYFAENPVTATAPTVCVSIAPRAFEDGQEKSLIARFPRLAPLDRCKPSGAGFVNGITGTPAQVVQIYDFACEGPASCNGWANIPGHPGTRYTQRWQDGSWRFAADLRLIER
jgi:hypothetical protein